MSYDPEKDPYLISEEETPSLECEEQIDSEEGKIERILRDPTETAPYC